MKKTNLLYFVGIGFLLFLPLIRVSVAAPPCWVGVYEDDVYIWSYNNHTAARWGQWQTDAMGITGLSALGKVISWFETMDDYGQTPGTMNHTILSLEDLGPDLEYGTNYPSVELAHELVYTLTGQYSYDWLDKLTGTTNVYNGLVLQNSDEFVLWHDDLTAFFSPENILETSLWVSTQINWDTVVTTATPGLAAVNATVAKVTDSTPEDIGFKITVPALAWINNTLAVELEVTYDEGLLDKWELTYGTEVVFDIALEQGSSQFVACPPPAPGIPG
jgi:hypothetical protein